MTLTPAEFQRLPELLKDVVRSARRITNATAAKVIPIADGPEIRRLRELHRQNVSAARHTYGGRLNGKDSPNGGTPVAVSA